MPVPFDDAIAEFVIGAVVDNRAVRIRDPVEDCSRGFQDIVRIDGRIQQVSPQEADEDFKTSSQLMLPLPCASRRSFPTARNSSPSIVSA
jgi:hypothetical protein